MPKVELQKGGKQPSNGKAKGSIINDIKPIGELDSKLKIALYGQSGSGKTAFWGTFDKDILAIICSGGGETRTLGNMKGVYAVPVKDEAQILDLVAYQASTNKYTTVVLDHATGLRDLVLKKVLEVEDLPAQFGWGIATQQQWGAVALRLKELLRAVISVDADVVIVSQEKEYNVDENVGEILAPYVNCDLGAGTAGWLGPNVDYLLQTFKRMETKEVTIKVANKEVKQKQETGKVEFCLRVGPHPVYTTKFRRFVHDKMPNLPDVITNPSKAKLVKLIESSS